MPNLLADLLDAFKDDDSVDVIEAGTLRTTRGTALVLVSLLTILVAVDAVQDEIKFIDGLSASDKLWFAAAAGGIWAVVSAADSLARGLAAGRTEAAKIVAGSSYALPKGLACTKTEGEDEDGYRAVALRPKDTEEGPEFLVVKGSTVEWVNASKLKFD